MLFQLAYELRIPVYQLVQMPYPEFLGWFSYFDRRPVGYREDIRTAYVLNALGVKKAPSELFESIKALYSTGNKQVDTLRRSAFYTKLKSAKGGATLDFL